MRTLRSVILSCFLILFYTASIAQKTVSKQNKQWFQYYNTLNLTDSWFIKSDAGFRLENSFSNKSQYIVRTSIGKKINTSIHASLGIAHLGFYSFDTISKLELRPYQELMFKSKKNKLRLNHRLRIEERFFNPGSFNFRFRYRFLMNYTLMEWGAENFTSSFSLIVADEIFINVGEDIIYNTFDQNRLMVGLGFKYYKVGVQFLYTHEYGAKNYKDQFRRNNIFWLGIKHKLFLV